MRKTMGKSGISMNRTKLVTLGCGTAVAVLLAGCGGGASGSAAIGGTVNGLTANSSVVLSDNGGNNLTVTGNGSASIGFSFSQTVGSQDPYSVAVATQPANQTCAVTNGTGLVDYAGNPVNDVVVACTNNAVIGATVAGLDAGNSLVLSLTLRDDPATAVETTVTAAEAASDAVNGTAITFTNSSGATVTLPLGTQYVVAVATQPANPAQVCTLSGSTPASGGVVNSNAITVSFSCQ